MLHIPIVHAHDVSKQIPQEKKFPSGWKCYKTLGSYVMCAFIRHVCVHRDMKHLGSLESTQEPMNQLLNEHVTKPDMQWYSKLTHPVYRVDSNRDCFAFSSLRLWWVQKNSRHFHNQSGAKLKTWSPAFSRALDSLVISSNWTLWLTWFHFYETQSKSTPMMPTE